MVNTAAIINDATERGSSLLLADFLNTIGIQTYDCPKSSRREAGKCDVIFEITDAPVPANSGTISVKPPEWADKDSRKEFLHTCIRNGLELDKTVQDELCAVADIYIDSDILRHKQAYRLCDACWSTEDKILENPLVPHYPQGVSQTHSVFPLVTSLTA